MNLNLNLSVAEVTRLNNEVGVAKGDIWKLIGELTTELNELRLNVHGNAVNHLFEEIDEKIVEIKNNMSGSLDDLIKFLSQQMVSYSDLYQQALEMLQKAFTFINEKISVGAFESTK